MKRLLLSIIILVTCSCGKKVNDSESDRTISASPQLEIIEDFPINAKNKDFSLSIEKRSFNHDEAIILTVRNVGIRSLNHLAFKFQGSTESFRITRLNCFDLIPINKSCNFALTYNTVDEGKQTITTTYSQENQEQSLVVEFNIIGSRQNSDTSFLYKKIHTHKDCADSRQFQKDGKVVNLNSNQFCEFRGINYYESENKPIDQNPLEAFNNTSQDSSAIYCPDDWTIASFKFEKSIFQEKKNFFSKRQKIEIPAGESREVCVTSGIFKCKKKSILYSRLTKVNCY